MSSSSQDTAPLPRTGRLLGIDTGERRLGVSISDPEQALAVPLKAIQRDGREMMEFEHLAREEEVAGLVVGLPLSLSGEAGAQAERARAFALELGNRLNLPVAFWDERLSSQEADRILAPEGQRGRPNQRSGRGPGRRPERGATDVVAATIILQAYLDSRRGRQFEV